ncbi:MAG: hypothetical protein ACK5OB_08525 [Pirellula sp.]
MTSRRIRNAGSHPLRSSLQGNRLAVWIPCLIAFAWIAIHGLAAQAQVEAIGSAPTAASDDAPLPYRRIFVPESQFSSLSIEGWKAIELDQLASALKRMQRNAVDPSDPDRPSGNGIAGLHAQAKLVGADLISERSRIRWDERIAPRSPRSPSPTRLLLTPWSLALDNPIFKSMDSLPVSGSPAINASSSPTWLFDESGRPSVRNDNADEWFTWSLRPAKDSTPNRLNYSLAIPRTPNSCLLLQLPKGARVTDATVVARQVEGWSAVSQRLNDWPVQPNLVELGRELNNPESLWMLELSGQEQASFSIQLGASSALGNAVNNDPANAVSRLISRQSVQCFVVSDALRTTCEWEWTEVPNTDAPLRIVLPQDARLRSLTLNDREPNLQITDRTMEVLLPTRDASNGTPPAFPSSTAANPSNGTKMRLVMELLTPLDEAADSENSGPPQPLEATAIRCRMEPIEIANAYVMAGTTSLIPSAPREIFDVATGSGRLESARALPYGAYRLDYSWFQRMPQISFATAANDRVATAELVTRLSNDTERIAATVRMQLSPWTDHRPRTIHIARGWRLDGSQINAKSLEVRRNEATATSGVSIELTTISPSDTTPIPLELQLSREVPTESDPNWNASPILELPGWLRRDALIMEPTASLRLELNGPVAEWGLDEESLTPWQKDRLPRLGKYAVYRMPHGILPPLHVRSNSAAWTVEIDSQLTLDCDRWRWEHRFAFPKLSSLPATRNEKIAIDASPNSQWSVSTPQGQRRLSAHWDASSQRWLWDATVLASLGETGPIVLIATSNDPPQTGSNHLLPQVLGAETLRRTFRADPSVLAIPIDPLGTWQLQSEGRAQLTWPPRTAQGPAATVRLEPMVRQSDQPQSVAVTQWHVAIDNEGHQRAAWIADWYAWSRHRQDVRMQVPYGWEAISAHLRLPNGERRPLTWNQQGRDLRLPARTLSGAEPQTSAECDTPLLADAAGDLDANATPNRIEVVFEGPQRSLTRHWKYGFWPERGLSFAWPRIEVSGTVVQSQQTLWLDGAHRVQTEANRSPTEFTTVPSGPALEIGWPWWNWTNEVWQSFQGPETATSQPDPQSAGPDSTAIPPDCLIPRWMQSHWSIAWQRTVTPNAPAEGLWIVADTLEPGNAWCFVIALLLTPRLTRWRPWWCFVFAIGLVVLGFWGPEPFAKYCRSMVVGVAAGMLAYQLYLVTTSVDGKRGQRAQRGDRWVPWNEPNDAADTSLDTASGSRSASRAGLATLILCILSIPAGLSRPFQSHLQAQDPNDFAAQSQPKPFDILIPVDEQSVPVGTTVYVPDSIFKIVSSVDDDDRILERDAYLISARHILRLDSRSIGFGNTEQACVHTYEFWIGEEAVDRPIRIPLQSDRTRLSRFTVDGTEVISSRVSRTETELLWYPDRTGRRVLQVESQIRVRPAEVGRNANSNPSLTGAGDSRPPRGWSVEAMILPCANAILEIESDGQWNIDLSARGKTTNPSIGRFGLHLGNIDRIAGVVSPASNAASRPLIAMPSDSPTATTEVPVMNTELWIDREQLMARTTVEFPRGADTLADLEIEADSQWQPIGSIWGDALLVDVRPGSTLDRKRFVLRWAPDSTEGSTSSSAPSTRRVVSTTWIPVGESPLRNVLFAECRDRRVRPGTLRYARAAGSYWTIDGINTNWIPLINSRERIDWPELSEKPLATSLKIPPSGGFGVLRQQPEAKGQRVRITNLLNVDRHAASLRSKLEFSTVMSHRSSLTVVLPEGYRATKATSRNIAVPMLQWKEEGQQHVQLLIDRDAGEISELTLACDGPSIEGEHVHSVVPFLELHGAVVQDQSTDVSADADWKISTSIDSDTTKVLRQSAISPRSLFTIPAIPGLEAPVWTATRCAQPWQGLMIAYPQDVGATGSDWELRLIAEPSADAVAEIELSVPTELASRWTTPMAWRESVDLTLQRRILLLRTEPIDAPGPSSMTLDFNAAPNTRFTPASVANISLRGNPEFRCWFAMDRDEVAASLDPTYYEIMDDAQASSWLKESGLFNHQLVRPKSIPSTGIASTEPSTGRNAIANRPDASIASPAVPRLSTHTERGRAFGQPEHRIVQSKFWMAPSAQPGSRTGLSEWTWTLPAESAVVWVQCNGQSLPWETRDDRVTVRFQSLDAPCFIELWTTVPIERSASELGNQERFQIPQLATSSPVASIYIPWGTSTAWMSSGQADDGSVPGVTNSNASGWRAIARSQVEAMQSEAWLDGLAQLQSIITKGTSETEPSLASDHLGPLGPWGRFYERAAHQSLQRLADASDASASSSYVAILDRWLDVRKQSPFHASLMPRANSPYLPWMDRHNRMAFETLTPWQREELVAMDPTKAELQTIPMQSWLRKNIGLLSMLLSMVLAVWLWQRGQDRLLQSPWWHLSAIAAVQWLVTGWWLPTLVLLSIAWIVAIDSYWMINERFRQSGLRGPRSL